MRLTASNSPNCPLRGNARQQAEPLQGAGARNAFIYLSSLVFILTRWAGEGLGLQLAHAALPDARALRVHRVQNLAAVRNARAKRPAPSRVYGV